MNIIVWAPGKGAWQYPEGEQQLALAMAAQWSIAVILQRGNHDSEENRLLRLAVDLLIRLVHPMPGVRNGRTAE